MIFINLKEIEAAADKHEKNHPDSKYPYMVGQYDHSFRYLKTMLVKLAENRDSLNKHELMDRLDNIISKLEFEQTVK